jgi:hypothetical protein
MLRYGTSFQSVPHEDNPGEYSIYATVTVWGDGECVKSFGVSDTMMTGLPDVHTTTDVDEWSIEWADIFYKFACDAYAKVKSLNAEESNAPRPEA